MSARCLWAAWASPASWTRESPLSVLQQSWRSTETATSANCSSGNTSGGQRSPDSIWDPLYWMDFDDRAPSLPPGTISVFCYHVGQLDDTDDRDSRYFGQGIGAGLLDHLLEWAASTGVAAVVAKASPSLRPVMSFMGGQPVEVYEERGFQTVSSWSDPDLAAAVVERGIATAEQLPAAATVSCCVLNLPEIR